MYVCILQNTNTVFELYIQILTVAIKTQRRIFFFNQTTQIQTKIQICKDWAGNKLTHGKTQRTSRHTQTILNKHRQIRKQKKTHWKENPDRRKEKRKERWRWCEEDVYKVDTI